MNHPKEHVDRRAEIGLFLLVAAIIATVFLIHVYSRPPKVRMPDVVSVDLADFKSFRESVIELDNLTTPFIPHQPDLDRILQMSLSGPAEERAAWARWYAMLIIASRVSCGEQVEEGVRAEASNAAVFYMTDPDPEVMYWGVAIAREIKPGWDMADVLRQVISDADRIGDQELLELAEETWRMCE